ncbi:MAG: hypothetical protein CSA38_00545 [Flavobacteriales bacterium]|nr:MAG: hypothetical protein CSA38_00545 [Flavobacteriales bacterium]
MNAQVFSWQNPNNKIDTLSEEQIVTRNLEQDYFSRDTLHFVQAQKQIVLEDAILAKNKKSKILGELNTKGAIIRGVSFGNNQGSAMRSVMDLKINGKLSKDISITASIYDQNLPVQADGYTQTIDEFDKIYIQLNIKDHSTIKAGHIDLDKTNTYFAKYQRRSMGLEFDTKFGKENKTFFNLSAGVARSEFQRMRFQGIEGNQGPYRLQGKNEELFISIIPDSEQVFIDGVLMKRGEKNDYTINYNTGEITFTNARPIFKQNFITISYNYTNRNYARYLITGGVKHQRKKWTTSINWFLENDNKNAPLSLNLSDEDKTTLASAGNNPDLMYAPSGVKTDYDVNKILYKKIINNNQFYYEYSTDENDTLYQVAFTYFGENKGDYRIKQTINNGRIFEYIGENNGDYKAVRKLTAPTKTQVISAQSEYQLHNGKVGFDFSLSNRDVNLFSSKNQRENIGYAGRIYAQKTFSKKDWKGSPSFEFQHINKQFHILDRINDVEFSRDFNLAQEFNQKTQNRLIFSFNNEFKKQSFLNYQFNYLEERKSYQGIKNQIDFAWKKGKFNTIGDFSYLKTKGETLNTQFVKGQVATELSQPKGKWSIGGSMEHNLKKINALNEYDTTSFSWKEVFLGKKIGDSARTYLDAKIYFRDNDSIRNNQLTDVNRLVGFQAKSEIIKTKNTQFNTLIHYRKFFYQVDNSASKFNQDFVIGNVEYRQKLWENGLRFQAFYELGNGQEALREFQYIKVTDGQGVYKWTDYNGDGVQQLDEFEVAEYSDLAQYIRVYTNATQYVPSNKNSLKLNLSIHPALIFKSKNKFLKRWDFNFSLYSQNSFFKKNKVLILNPFEKNKDQILKNQNFLALAKFKNTASSGWSISYRFNANNNLINANFSKEERMLNAHFVNIGYRFSKTLNFSWENSFQDIKNSSENFKSRDFTLHNFETQPKLTYQFSTRIQSEISTGFKHKKRTDGIEKLKTYNITGGIQWKGKKTGINAQFSFINNDFSGNNFSIVGNQMLNGLKAGKNQVWSLSLQQQINSFLQLNLNYEGRNTNQKTIHIGGMQVSAHF